MSRTAHMTAGDRGGHLILMTRFPKASATSTTRSFNPLFFPLSTWTRALSVIFHPLLHRNKKKLAKTCFVYKSRARPLTNTNSFGERDRRVKNKSKPRTRRVNEINVCLRKQTAWGGVPFTNTRKGSEFWEKFWESKGKIAGKKGYLVPPVFPTHTYTGTNT